MSIIRFKNYLNERIPLILVFFSGLGFSLQALAIKLLYEYYGFQGGLSCVFSRGILQMIMSSILIYVDKGRNNNNVKLFGNSNYVRWILFWRSIFGYLSIMFNYLSVELLPIGDSAVLGNLLL